MFTGLIEEVGQIEDIKYSDNALYIKIKAEKVLDGIKIGDSIAINGACQTVTEYTDRDFTVFSSAETVKVTNFSSLKKGQYVNLERAMLLSQRLDGHIVSGHVDGVAYIDKIEKFAENTEIHFTTEKQISNQIVKKGSVTINGISLTVADVADSKFKVAVIPHTLKNTNLNCLKTGDTVNIETDIIAKYVEKYLSSNHNNTSIDMNFLERNGFL